MVPGLCLAVCMYKREIQIKEVSLIHIIAVRISKPSEGGRRNWQGGRYGKHLIIRFTSATVALFE